MINNIKISVLGLLMVMSISLAAQSIEGTITYNRKTDWISIMSKLPWVTQEDIDRRKLTWGNEESKGRDYVLTFKDDKSVYTYKKEESSVGYSWKKDPYLIIRDHGKNTYIDQRDFVGKTYKIKGNIAKTKWKILNELKEINGYICMKAETYDPVTEQTVHAWFTDALPFFGGPEGFSGLPGMILEINKNEGDAIITATEIDLNTAIEKLPIPKKIKGKDIAQEEYNLKMTDFIAESIEGQKNPWWRLRY